MMFIPASAYTGIHDEYVIRLLTNLNSDSYRSKIHEKLISHLRSLLTNGREDRDLTPFTESEIESFILENDSEIYQVVIDMCADCTDELGDGGEGADYCYREALQERFPELFN